MNRASNEMMMVRHQIMMSSAANHAPHDEMLCAYADAAAENVLQAIEEQIPVIVEREIQKYMSANKAGIELDPKALNHVKSTIVNAFRGLFR